MISNARLESHPTSSLKTAVLPLIFISSFSCLAYEIVLIRIFSVTLWYHFAFMVISIAMLGIGASGTMLSVFPKARDIRFIPFYALLLALSIPVSYLVSNAIPFDPAKLSWDRLQLLYIGLYCFSLSLPFFWFGLIVGTGYSGLIGQPGFVYASDLLGAGTGSLSALLLLSLAGPEYAVFVLPSSICLALLFVMRGVYRYASSALFIIFALIVAIYPEFMRPAISPYKPLKIALTFPGAEHLSTAYSPYSRVDVLKSPAVRYAPGLSLRYLEPLPKQVGIVIDAGELHAMTDEKSKEELAFVKYLPSGLAYHLFREGDVLILEPRAGLPIITAAQYNAKNIYAVDSNPLLIRTVRQYAPSLSSRIYEDNTWTGLGRSWLRSQTRRFDVIDVSFTGAMPAGTFGFSEDYRLTKEAIQTYITYLKEDGILSISLYIIPPLRTELRLLSTLIEAVNSQGIEDISKHLAAIRTWGSLTMIIKKTSLTRDDIRRIKSFAEAMRYDLVHYPGIKPEESNKYIRTPENEHHIAFQRILNAETTASFIDNYSFDISPVDDNKPFFHYYLRLKNIKEIYRMMGGKWQYFIEEGYLLPVLSIQAALLSLALIILPVVPLRKKLPAETISMVTPMLLYFSLLGTGYMAVMLITIQKMILVLEYPAYAASAAVASVLVGSGMGGLLSSRFETLRTPPVLLALAGFIVLSGITLPLFGNAISPLPLFYKIPLIVLVIAPLGFFMGLPFPLGMSILGKRMPWAIPWAWAANAFCSVQAPILAIMIALQTGFQAIFMGGAGLYVLGYFIIKRQIRAA